MPARPPSWELVRFAVRDQLEAVFTNGVVRLWRGWPVGWDARALMREVANRVAAAVAEASIHRVHPLADEHRARFRPASR